MRLCDRDFPIDSNTERQQPCSAVASVSIDSGPSVDRTPRLCRLLAALESHLAAHLAILVSCDLLAALFDDTAHPSTSFRSSQLRGLLYHTIATLANSRGESERGGKD